MSRPGPKPRLTRDEIADAALAVLTEEGPARFSMRRVAAEVGVTPRALYSYFESKDHLETAIVDRVMPAPPTEIDSGVSWHVALRAFVMDIHDAFAANPGAAKLFAEQSMAIPAMDRVREHLLTLLMSSGLGTDDAVSALGALARYLVGCVLVEEARAGGSAVRETTRLRTLPAHEFPTLTSIASDYAGRNTVVSMQFGLDLIIQGLRDASENPAVEPKSAG